MSPRENTAAQLGGWKAVVAVCVAMTSPYQLAIAAELLLMMFPDNTILGRFHDDFVVMWLVVVPSSIWIAFAVLVFGMFVAALMNVRATSVLLLFVFLTLPLLCAAWLIAVINGFSNFV